MHRRIAHAGQAAAVVMVAAATAPGDELIWDNMPHGACSHVSSQKDVVYPFDSQAADDFKLTAATRITALEWVGNFQADEPISVPQWNVIFYEDAGGTPPGGPDDPTGAAVAVFHLDGDDVSCSEIRAAQYLYEADLDTAFLPSPGDTYWIVIQAEFPFPPGWGMACAIESLSGGELMFGYPLLGYDYWLSDTEAFGETRDLAFRLYGIACPADVTGDGLVDVLDLLEVLAQWGGSGGGSADITGDGIVDVLDLLEVLAAWGSCP